MRFFLKTCFLASLLLSPTLLLAIQSEDVNFISNGESNQDILNVIEKIDKTANTYMQDISKDKRYRTANPRRQTLPLKTKLTKTKLTKTKLTATESAKKASEKVFSTASTSQPLKNSDEVKEVQLSVNEWAKVWSKGDYKAYINMYASNYSPRNKSRTQWLKNRRQRIKPAKKIQVEITNLEFKELKSKGQIRSRFMQGYRSIHYRDKARKELRWKKEKGQWRIVSERTIK